MSSDTKCLMTNQPRPPPSLSLLPQADFRDILERYGVSMSDNEFEKLLRAYDPFNSGKVCS